MKSTSLESESEASSVSICLIEASGRCALFDLRHTFAKWLRPPQFRHFVPHAGHFSFLNACSLPQNKHGFQFPFVPRVLSVLRPLSLESRWRILFTSSGFSARNHLKLRACRFRTSAYVDALTQGEFPLLEESFPRLLASHAKNDSVLDKNIVQARAKIACLR